MRINPGQVGALMVITRKAGQGQVVRFIGAVVFPSDDVLDVEGQFVPFLPDAAILAVAPGPLAHATL